MDQDGLNKSKEISIQGLKLLLGNVTSEKHNLEQELENALTYFTKNVDIEKDTIQKTGNALSTAQSALNFLRQAKKLTWHNWLHFCPMTKFTQLNNIKDVPAVGRV